MKLENTQYMAWRKSSADIDLLLIQYIHIGIYVVQYALV